MTSDIASYYSKKLADSIQAQKKLKNKLVLGSTFRLLFFILILFSIYHLFLRFQIGWLLFLVMSLIGFLGMISWYVNIKNRAKYEIQLGFLFQNELNQIDGVPNGFDDGKNFDDVIWILRKK